MRDLRSYSNFFKETAGPGDQEVCIKSVGLVFQTIDHVAFNDFFMETGIGAGSGKDIQPGDPARMEENDARLARDEAELPLCLFQVMLSGFESIVHGPGP